MENIHILLADDDADDRDFFQEALIGTGIRARVTMVEDGAQLTEFLDGITNPPPPDIIFLDINMPYKNGKQCLQEIRQEKKFDKVPIVMFSTSSQLRDIEETYIYGANLYINKSDFFDNEADMLEKLFSPGWKEYMSKASRENYVFK